MRVEDIFYFGNKLILSFGKLDFSFQCSGNDNK